MTARRDDPHAAAVVTQAAYRAARALGFTRRELAQRLTLPPEAALDLAAGRYRLRAHTPAWRTALALTRVFVALEALTGGDAATRAAWLAHWNRDLRGIPRQLLRHDAGLAAVLAYLESLHTRR